jgi:pyruvate ferredoxin oxidoreductase beta subunit
MGMSATSGALDRDLDFIYICYDNEGYGNTGQQYSSATPHGAATATSRGSRGYPGYKKDLFSIWAAHRPSYVATVIGSEPLDLAKKIEKARDMKGPRMIIALSPCPTGWDYDPRDSVEIGKLAVKTGVWPLKEYVNGQVVHTRIPRERPPVQDYLRRQGRFSHLFQAGQEPSLVDDIQQRVDDYWKEVV